MFRFFYILFISFNCFNILQLYASVNINLSHKNLEEKSGSDNKKGAAETFLKNKFLGIFLDTSVVLPEQENYYKWERSKAGVIGIGFLNHISQDYSLFMNISFDYMSEKKTDLFGEQEQSLKKYLLGADLRYHLIFKNFILVPSFGFNMGLGKYKLDNNESSFTFEEEKFREIYQIQTGLTLENPYLSPYFKIFREFNLNKNVNYINSYIGFKAGIIKWF